LGIGLLGHLDLQNEIIIIRERIAGTLPFPVHNRFLQPLSQRPMPP